jgi:hypothetical protein
MLAWSLPRLAASTNDNGLIMILSEAHQISFVS